MRTAELNRKTNETDITLKINLDGSGKANVSTGIAFFDHMLTSFARHSGFDLDIVAKGDIEVDCHHTVEDVGIVLGECIRRAAADKVGIERFWDCSVPMDESLAFAALDAGGRAFLCYSAEFTYQMCGEFETAMAEEFFRALAFGSACALHVKLLTGSNDHHRLEAIFKAVARCYGKAYAVTGSAVPSTKGCI